MTRVHKRMYFFFPPVAGNRNPFTPAHVRRGLCQPASKANIQFCWSETISQVFYQQIGFTWEQQTLQLGIRILQQSTSKWREQRTFFYRGEGWAELLEKVHWRKLGSLKFSGFSLAEL